MIFPGMDPYLEDPLRWPGLHAALIVYTRDYLQPLVRPRYLAAIEERVYLEGPDRDIIPDVLLREHRPQPVAPAASAAEGDAPILVEAPELLVRETYVTIQDRKNGKKVVTVIEFVNPTNKAPGAGRQSYVTKQQEVRGSDAHLVEIDLLRTGLHVLAVPESSARRRADYQYLVSVNRAQLPRHVFELYPRSLRERLPRVRVPLLHDDADVVLDLQAILARAYDAGDYADALDYQLPCMPALTPPDQQWADQLIRQDGQTASE